MLFEKRSKNAVLANVWIQTLINFEILKPSLNLSLSPYNPQSLCVIINDFIFPSYNEELFSFERDKTLIGWQGLVIPYKALLQFEIKPAQDLAI